VQVCSVKAFSLTPSDASRSLHHQIGTSQPHKRHGNDNRLWNRQDSLRLYAAGLWERLEIEEDPEPMWYLLNCVAGLELDLLNQCREVCRDMPQENVVKFVVPTEKKTRSHGANRMVTETKVKYLGYVFGKLRLCKEVYEAIQELDLCRSWMGTVNHKGYKKLPPAPLALNELEVEKFGLEEWQDDDEQEDSSVDSTSVGEDGDVVIVDDASNDEPEVDQEALKIYLGLKVEDMIKVTAKGKFYNEDGIVRRLKEGNILVRFYTYGTMYEEWLKPTDVRKLSNMEILKGLSGPSQPITQRDFDGDRDGGRGGGPDPFDDRRGGISFGGPGAGRNRRQDRVANRFSKQDRDFFGRTEEQRRREERNWNWYKDQQRQDNGRFVSDRDGGRGKRGEKIQAGSGNDADDWAIGDVDSQWGRSGNERKSQRQRRREEQRERNKYDSRRTEAALGGQEDWSAFVSPSSTPDQTEGGGDDFFDSLMTDLSNDLNDNGAVSRESGSGGRRQPAPTESTQDEDDFFASLMSDLTGHNTDSSPPDRKRSKDATSDVDDDFFAALEAELSPISGGDGAPLPSTNDIATRTVPKLKEMLRERGLKVSGKKAELIQRLTSAGV